MARKGLGGLRLALVCASALCAGAALAQGAARLPAAPAQGEAQKHPASAKQAEQARQAAREPQAPEQPYVEPKGPERGQPSVKMPLDKMEVDIGPFEQAFIGWWGGPNCKAQVRFNADGDFLDTGKPQRLLYVSFDEDCSGSKAKAVAGFFERGDRGAWRLLASFDMPPAKEARVQGQALWLKERLRSSGGSFEGEALASFAKGELSIFRKGLVDEEYALEGWIPDFKANCGFGPKTQAVFMQWLMGDYDKEGRPVWKRGTVMMPRETARGQKTARFEEREERGTRWLTGKSEFSKMLWMGLPVDFAALERAQGSQTARFEIQINLPRRQALRSLRDLGWNILDGGIAQGDQGRFELLPATPAKSKLVCLYGESGS